MFRVKIIILFASLLIGLLFLHSCECVPDIVTPRKIIPDQYANVMFLNSNSDFDLMKFQTESGNFVVNSFYLTEKFSYQSMIPGIVNVQILTQRDSMLFNSVMDLNKSYPYTFFAFGNADRVQGLLLVDTVFRYSKYNTFFRCINLAMSSPYIKFLIVGSYPIEKIKPYKTSSGFYPISSGLYKIEIRNATNDSLLLTYNNAEFKPGRAYSLLLRGYYSGIGHRKMNLQIVESDFLYKKSQRKKK